MQNQASSVKSGDALMYVLMWGMAWLLPVVSAFHRLQTQTGFTSALQDS